MNLFVFFLFGLTPARADGVLLDRLEASVNQYVILKSDIDRFRKTVTLRMQTDPLFGTGPLSKRANVLTDSEIKQELIRDKVIESKFPVTEADVDQSIHGIETSQNITNPQLRGALKEQGYNWDDYRALIRVQLAKMSLINTEIRPKVLVSDEEVKTKYTQKHKDAREERVFSFSVFSSPSRQKLEEKKRELLISREAFNAAKKEDLLLETSEVGPIGEKDLSKEYQKILFKLTPGRSSEVVQSNDKNYYFLWLKKVDSKLTSISEKELEALRQELSTQEYNEQIALWLDRVQKSMNIKEL